MRLARILAGVVLGTATSASLGVSYNEGVNGDLSGNRLAPTNIGVLPIGTHTLTATTIGGDLEYWRISIPAGTRLSQLVLASYTGEDATAFIAVQTGSQFTETNNAPNVANILGYSHFGTGVPSALPGTDILDNIGTGAGSIGFVPPLAANTYTFWTQQTGVDSCTYTFNIVVTAAPFPASDYAESVNGDLSGNRLTPTNLGILKIGSNTVAGSTINGDLDYYRVHVPVGTQMTQMNLTHFASEDDLGFIALQNGTQFTETNNAPNVANILGYTHFGSTATLALVGTDILDNIGTGAGSIGFSPPLPAGDYTFWVQQTDVISVAYRFDMVLTNIGGPVAYDENVNGDLSGNRLAPTNLTPFTNGTHSVRGTTVTGDVDYVHINVPSGSVLAQMVLSGYASTDDFGFIAVQAGSTFTETAGAPNVANILGYVHFGTAGLATPGTDILDNIGTGAGAIGFVPPLPAGDYTFWIQQTDAPYIDYKFDFVVTTAPPPPVDYDEAIDGDLSGNRASPTNLGTIGVGDYSLRGSAVFGDLDYWRITIPAGAQLSQLNLLDYIGEDAVAFNAIQSGSSFTEDANSPNVANILGYSHFGPGVPTALPGTDILDNMGTGPGSIGFTPPLPAGTYSFWTQQTGNDECTYTFELVVTTAPPPACPGDVNGDGFTNTSDFNILAGNFGGGPGLTRAQGDLSGDGFVNTSDFNILAGDFGCD